MIRLQVFLGIPDLELNKYKIHFARGGVRPEEAKEIFYADEFQSWQECQTKKNFEREYVISLIWIEKNKWLYAGVYEVDHSVRPKSIENPKYNWKGWKYKTIKTNVQEDMIGRVVFYYEKNFRASYPCLELEPSNSIEPRNMQICKIYEERLAVDDFTGFDEVNISYDILKVIVNKKIKSWYNALSKVKGIYLIVDTTNGKQYVGSAYGENCIFSRWESYVNTGHGGNIELKKLLEENGIEYVKNFKYSILEVCNMNIGETYIIERETYWKNVLMTREFGLNSN